MKNLQFSLHYLFNCPEGTNVASRTYFMVMTYVRMLSFKQLEKLYTSRHWHLQYYVNFRLLVAVIWFLLCASTLLWKFNFLLTSGEMRVFIDGFKLQLLPLMAACETDVFAGRYHITRNNFSNSPPAILGICKENTFTNCTAQLPVVLIRKHYNWCWILNFLNWISCHRWYSPTI